MSAHTCHADGCARAVPPRMFMCRPHWHAVPEELRAELLGAYVSGQEIRKDPSAAWLDVAFRCIAAVAASGVQGRLL